MHAVEYYIARKRKDRLLSYRMDPQTKCVPEGTHDSKLAVWSLYIKLKTGKANPGIQCWMAVISGEECPVAGRWHQEDSNVHSLTYI